MSKNFYITTPIYYPSGKPHMGHAYSSIVADIFARFKLLDGYNVLFLTGTDEHGQKIEKEAKKNKKDPKIFCDELYDKFKNYSHFKSRHNFRLDGNEWVAREPDNNNLNSSQTCKRRRCSHCTLTRRHFRCYDSFIYYPEQANAAKCRYNKLIVFMFRVR